MATEPDPYRTLGLPRTATLAEVRAAYRRLAKANHPDAAGETALPRFLAIQAAYERLVGPTGRPRATPTAPAKPRQPWEADPDRSDATRRAYGGRARGPAGTGGTRKGSKPGAGSSGGGAASGSSPRPGTTKDPKKATLGSTSYDEADREAFEPDWVGASWYGTTSGTYWTINPKEYADPRKHGPEYQARARRASQGAAATEPGEVAAGATGAPADAGAEAANTAGATNGAGATEAGGGPDPTPRHTTSSWWDATSGPAADAREAVAPPSPRSAPRPRHAARPHPTGSASGSAGAGLSGIGRALTMGEPPSLGWRIARAVIGWLPIALAIGWAAGEISGCARYSATCDSGLQPIALGLQAIVFVVLMALPVVAGWAVIAALVSLAVAVPATLFVTASTGSEASSVGPDFLGVALVAAWVVGIVGAIVASRRQSFEPTGPVS